MNRQNWSSEEDITLKKFVQKLGVADWTSIAEHLRTECRNSTRTGKQCRERWYNHLIPTVNKKSWTVEEETKLFEAHRLYGNKWKDIARQIEGRYYINQCRTDNDIKNHFYSTLRRSLRRLNKIIGEKNSTSQIREIKPSVLTTIMDFIYRNADEDANELLSSLKGTCVSNTDLPLLILQFASFKPKKGNYGDKLSEQARDKIETILHLVNSFKQALNQRSQSYCRVKKEKNGSNAPSQKENQEATQVDTEKGQRKSKGRKTQDKLKVNNAVKIEHVEGSMDVEDQRELDSLEEKGIEGQQEEDGCKLMTNVKTETEMNNSFMRLTIPNYPPQFMSFNFIPRMMLDEDYQPDGMPEAMQHIQDPSSLNLESQMCGLEIVGKHWSPQPWQKTQEDQLDEILEMNYDNM